MVSTKAQNTEEINNAAKIVFYWVTGEGYKALQDQRTRTIDDVRVRHD